MRLPRDLSGDDLSKKLHRVGYKKVRQTGSHMRLYNSAAGGHSITIPKHKELRSGTLSAILHDVAHHLSMSKQELQAYLFE